MEEGPSASVSPEGAWDKLVHSLSSYSILEDAYNRHHTLSLPFPDRIKSPLPQVEGDLVMFVQCDSCLVTNEEQMGR